MRSHQVLLAVGDEHVRSVVLVGSDAKLSFEQRADGPRVRLPDRLRANMHTPSE